jgi:hypothetical protein
MAIEIDTSAWAKRNGVRPNGEHYWRFVGEGPTVGAGRAKHLHYTLETDGPWGEAKERALEAFRGAFGVTADITVRLMP